MHELKELFLAKFEKQLLQIQSDITSIKQQQARQIVSSNLIESLKKKIIDSNYTLTIARMF